jgi:RNA polymerase sigma factor (sigma-70 family)
MRPLVDEGSTSPTLLREVSNWHNHSAWLRFRSRYDPLLRKWCRGYSLDDDSIDEVCQRLWIELAGRMRTFRYDPNGTFRGWLRQVCRSRVLDYLRRRRASALLGLDERDDEQAMVDRRFAIDSAETDQSDDEPDPLRLFLLGEAEKVQATVRAKVQPRTWDVFWLVSVRDWTVEQTAHSLGMTHAAVYEATKRVARMLCDEGERVSSRWPAGG